MEVRDPWRTASLIPEDYQIGLDRFGFFDAGKFALMKIAQPLAAAAKKNTAANRLSDRTWAIPAVAFITERTRTALLNLRLISFILIILT